MADSHPNLNGHSPLHKRTPPRPKRRPSQASGQAPSYQAPGASGGVVDQAARGVAKKAKKKARNIGNALLPGNPFGG